MKLATRKELREYQMEALLHCVKSAGELVKKRVGHGHPERRAALWMELVSVLKSVAALAERLDSDFLEVMEMNRTKLNERYKSGFSTKQSLARGQ